MTNWFTRWCAATRRRPWIFSQPPCILESQVWPTISFSLLIGLLSCQMSHLPSVSSVAHQLTLWHAYAQLAHLIPTPSAKSPSWLQHSPCVLSRQTTKHRESKNGVRPWASQLPPDPLVWILLGRMEPPPLNEHSQSPIESTRTQPHLYNQHLSPIRTIKFWHSF